MLRKFNPEGVADGGLYSHGVEVTGAQRLLFISGQVGVRADGSVAEGIVEQTRQALENLRAVLAGADMGLSDIVKFTIFLTDEANFGGFIEAASGALPMPPPAATLVYVKALASPALLFEIEAIAAK